MKDVCQWCNSIIEIHHKPKGEAIFFCCPACYTTEWMFREWMKLRAKKAKLRDHDHG